MVHGGLTLLDFMGYRGDSSHDGWSTSTLRSALPSNYSSSKIFFVILIIAGTPLIELKNVSVWTIGCFWIILTLCLLFNQISTLEAFIAILITFNRESSTMKAKMRNKCGWVPILHNILYASLSFAMTIGLWIGPLTGLVIIRTLQNLVPFTGGKDKKSAKGIHRFCMDYFFFTMLFLIMLLWSTLMLVISITPSLTIGMYESSTAESMITKLDEGTKKTRPKIDIKQAKLNVFVDIGSYMPLFSILLLITEVIWLVPLIACTFFSPIEFFTTFVHGFLLIFFKTMPMITLFLWTIVIASALLVAFVDKWSSNMQNSITFEQEVRVRKLKETMTEQHVCPKKEEIHEQPENQINDNSNKENVPELSNMNMIVIDVPDISSTIIFERDESEDLSPPKTMPTYDDNLSVCSDLSQFSRQSKRVLRSKKLLQITSDGDVWYERKMVHKRTGRKRSFFISEKTGRTVIDEPPSGAAEVIYVDEFMNQREGDLLDLDSQCASYVDDNNNNQHEITRMISKDNNADVDNCSNSNLSRRTQSSYRRIPSNLSLPTFITPVSENLDDESVVSEFSQSSMQWNGKDSYRRRKPRLMRRQRRLR